MTRKSGLLATILMLLAGSARAETAPPPMKLAFVLLAKPALPAGEAVAAAFTGFAPGKTLVPRPSPPAKGQVSVLELDAGACGTALVSLMPAPVPDREADEAAAFSVSGMGTGWTLPPHAAHLIVTLSGGSESGTSRLSCFTSLLAAVTSASGAVGVYWGDAGATHDPKFVTSVAKDADPQARLMLWTGVSVAREPDGRLSFLSLGMRQLDLPDLLLVTPSSMGGTDALGMLFDLLSYVARRGSALPEGDTVGRDADEKLPVRYVPSPIDPAQKVWRVEVR